MPMQQPMVDQYGNPIPQQQMMGAPMGGPPMQPMMQ